MTSRRRVVLLVLVLLLMVAGLMLVPPVRWAVIGWLRGWPSLDIPESGFAEPELSWPQYTSDNETKQVLKLSAPGQIQWSTTLDGYLGGVRPPHVVWDADRVYVSHGDGVTALDAQTGKVVWHSPGPQERLCLSNKLLLAAQCGESELSKEPGRWLFARSVQTGEVIFRVLLENVSDPNEVRSLADLFLVQDTEVPGGNGKTLLIDQHGQVRYRLDRQVIDGIPHDGGHVLLTSKDVVCLATDGTVRWSCPFPEPIWIAGGGLMQLDDGDVLAFLYGRINDSGVHVMRIDRLTGTPIWQAYCQGLGAEHSAYNHQAMIEVIDGKYVKVISVASGGNFAELLDLQSGSRLQRNEPDSGRRRGWLDWLSRWLP